MASLHDQIEFDHPFVVNEDGTISDSPLYAPTLHDGQLDSSAWEMLNGYSMQDSYAGPIMHNSEYVGGLLEQDILSTPGTYCLVVANWTNDQWFVKSFELDSDGSMTTYNREYTADDEDHAKEQHVDAFPNETYIGAYQDENRDCIEGWAVCKLKEDENDG